MPLLQIIIASTRPGRVGLPVAEWFRGEAAAHGGFDLELVDLAEADLPLMNEPNHPRLHDYQHDHTKAWSATIERGDAFVFVMPEYNYGITAPLKNAIDYLNAEWAYKPAGLVSYGGVSAGLRAAQQVKQVLGALRMAVAVDAVSIPFVGAMIDDEGKLQPNEIMRQAASAMLDELVRLETAMRPLRPGA